MQNDLKRKNTAAQLVTARDHYVAQVEKLLDPEESRKLFKKHLFQLSGVIRTLNEDRELVQEIYGDSVVGHTMVQKFDHQINARRRAHDAILADQESARIHLRDSLQEIIHAFDDSELSPIDSSGKLKTRMLRRVRHSGREGSIEDIEARYRPIDAWLERGFGHVFSAPGAEERAYQLALVPMKIREAQWRFMLSLSDAIYDLGLSDSHTRSLAKAHLSVLPYLLARLSNHERGILNPHMPEEYQARHNPAIHSMHVVALLDKVFHDATENLRTTKGVEPRDLGRLYGKLREMRMQSMLCALVHDMGEMDGEPKEGATMIGQPKSAHATIKGHSDEIEKWAFDKYLEQSRKRLGVEYKKGSDGDARWQELRGVYQGAFDLVEHGDTEFLGLLIKAVERIQSQHDYWRFSQKGSGKPLSASGGAERDFSMNYVAARLYDAPWNADAPGDKALMHLIGSKRASDETLLYGVLYQAVEQEYRRYFPTQMKAYGIPGADQKDFLGKEPTFVLPGGRAF